MDWLTDARPAFEADGLLPVIVQDAGDGSVLMLGWANAEALAATERSGEAHLWSRSRDRLWRKGETSGNVMHVASLATDCDRDAILYRVRPEGPACHTGSRTCFGESEPTGLAALETIISERRGADIATSYTARLLAGGPRRPAEKVVEEAGEVAAAALAGSDEEVVEEAADLAYHLLVLLASRHIDFARVIATLDARHASSQTTP